MLVEPTSPLLLHQPTQCRARCGCTCPDQTRTLPQTLPSSQRPTASRCLTCIARCQCAAFSRWGCAVIHEVYACVVVPAVSSFSLSVVLLQAPVVVLERDDLECWHFHNVSYHMPRTNLYGACWCCLSMLCARVRACVGMVLNSVSCQIQPPSFLATNTQSATRVSVFLFFLALQLRSAVQRSLYHIAPGSHCGEVVC